MRPRIGQCLEICKTTIVATSLFEHCYYSPVQLRLRRNSSIGHPPHSTPKIRIFDDSCQAASENVSCYSSSGLVAIGVCGNGSKCALRALLCSIRRLHGLYTRTLRPPKTMNVPHMAPPSCCQHGAIWKDQEMSLYVPTMSQASPNFSTPSQNLP